jgi:hypothetical protein
MRTYEQVKTFMGSDMEELEKMYNEWIREQCDYQATIPALKGLKFTIIDRVLSIRNYDGEETFALAIFYQHYDLLAQEQGADRGGKMAGASAFGREGMR